MQLEKEEQRKPYVSRRNHKEQSRNKETEIKKTTEKMKETKSWFFKKVKLINLQPDSSRKKGEGANQ